MSLPHDIIKTSTRALTVKTKPDQEEIRLRLQLLKRAGYEIDESKIKSWGPNLQKMWSEISGRYITVNGKPYVAAQQKEPEFPLYISMDNKKRYMPFDRTNKKPEKNLINLLFLQQYQTPFFNTPLVDNMGRTFRRNKYEEIEFKNKSVNPASGSDEYKSKFNLWQAPIGVYGPRVININPFYNDLISKGMKKSYDFNSYSLTPTVFENSESNEENSKESNNTSQSTVNIEAASDTKPKKLITKKIKQSSPELRFDPISGLIL